MPSDPARRPLVAVLAIGCLLLLGAVGCRRYPGASEKTYKIAQALYSICQQKATDRLAVVETLIDEGEQAGDIPADQAGWLRDIVADATAGDWEDAAREARRIMSDQADL